MMPIQMTIFVTLLRIGFMRILHDRHTMVVFYNNIVLLAAVEVCQPQLRLLPIDPILGIGVAYAIFTPALCPVRNQP